MKIVLNIPAGKEEDFKKGFLQRKPKQPWFTGTDEEWIRYAISNFANLYYKKGKGSIESNKTKDVVKLE